MSVLNSVSPPSLYPARRPCAVCPCWGRNGRRAGAAGAQPSLSPAGPRRPPTPAARGPLGKRRRQVTALGAAGAPEGRAEAAGPGRRGGAGVRPPSRRRGRNHGAGGGGGGGAGGGGRRCEPASRADGGRRGGGSGVAAAQHRDPGQVSGDGGGREGAAACGAGRGRRRGPLGPGLGRARSPGLGAASPNPSGPRSCSVRAAAVQRREPAVVKVSYCACRVPAVLPPAWPRLRRPRGFGPGVGAASCKLGLRPAAGFESLLDWFGVFFPCVYLICRGETVPRDRCAPSVCSGVLSVCPCVCAGCPWYKCGRWVRRVSPERCQALGASRWQRLSFTQKFPAEGELQN